jgi:DNA (cytosine-5)-methyltransferase 1
MKLDLYEVDGQLTFLDPEEYICESCKKARRGPTRKDLMELVAVPIQVLDLTPGHGDLLGDAHWEIHSPLLEDGTLLNTGVAPREPICSSLSSILEPHPDRKYYLSRTACLGILRRADERGKELPEQLKAALMAQAGLVPVQAAMGGLKAYHINQRDEGIDLGGVSGALLATMNMQMQTFVTGEPVAFAANQRDEVRDLHDVAGALGAQPGMKQQTFITDPCLTPWDTQQKRIFLPDGVAPTLAGADGGGGRTPGGLLFAAFSAGAGAKAGGIGYSEEVAPTLKGSASGNCMPSLLCLNDQGGERMDVTVEQTTTLRAQAGGHQPLICLNDQGGSVMECSVEVSGTLRAQEHGHQPLVFDTHGQDCRFQGPTDTAQTVTAAFGMGGGNMPLIVGGQTDEKPRPLVFENHGIDSRYTGPHKVAPTISARAGTGGNNLPLVAAPEQEEPPVICITGNAIDRQPQNGGNGIGVSQEGVAFTLTATDRHAVFSRQRVDVFKSGDVVSTESARQHKDATDLVYQATVGALTSSDRKGPNSQYVGQDKLVVEGPLLIRRLTPLECERLQGFPDLWTALPGAADSARYKALGNSVAIPCVEFIMRQIAHAARLPLEL